MEGTQQTEYLLPIIFTTVIANYVGNTFNTGIFEMALALKQVPFLDHQTHHQFIVFQARHCMNPCVRVLNLTETVGRILEELHANSHSGYPVVVTGSRRYTGFILRDQLLTMLETVEFSADNVHSTGTLLVEKHGPYSRENFSSVDDWISFLHVNLTDDDKDIALDLESMMNAGPHVVTPDCPLSRAFLLFCAMGLRHLVVVDGHHKVVGVITRKDLLAMERIVCDNHMKFEQKATLVAKMQKSRFEEGSTDVDHVN
eukprot:c39749_g1_i1.p1 GENE.c39749_g1_i1~~c39749_g1_i1.p1  ORF type:complete len:257 (+),score=57.30 c39749_g1_i1:2-772(+)